MNEELTNEVLEAIVNCNGKCIGCPAQSVCDAVGIKRSLATALLEERAKQKDDPWDGAPEAATIADIYWSNEWGFDLCSKRLTREIPKTRTRQIAEREGHGLAEKYGWHDAAKEIVTNRIEAALNKYAKELERNE